jgi:hypothetical protein
MKTTNFNPGWAVFVETQKGRFFIETGIVYYGSAKERSHDMAIKGQSRTIRCNQWFITDRPGAYCNDGGREEFEAAYPDLLEGAKLNEVKA